MPEIVRAALVQQSWTGDKDSMIRASVSAIEQAASAGAQVVCLQELFYGPYFCQVQDAPGPAGPPDRADESGGVRWQTVSAPPWSRPPGPATRNP